MATETVAGVLNTAVEVTARVQATAERAAPALTTCPKEYRPKSGTATGGFGGREISGYTCENATGAAVPTVSAAR